MILAHVDNEMCLVRALERLGSAALSKEEPDIGAAFLKFSVVTKELSALMKTLVQTHIIIIMNINQKGTMQLQTLELNSMVFFSLLLNYTDAEHFKHNHVSG